jgi:hypothetical protein
VNYACVIIVLIALNPLNLLELKASRLKLYYFAIRGIIGLKFAIRKVE